MNDALFTALTRGRDRYYRDRLTAADLGRSVIIARRPGGAGCV